MFGVIVTDYNTMNETFEYIQRFLKVSKNVRFVIVDNSLNENGKKKLISDNFAYSKIKIHKYNCYTFNLCGTKILMVENISNNGYAGGNNLGVRVYNEVYGEPSYYIFSNNDIYFNDSFSLEHITYIFHENTDIGIIGPKILSESGDNQNPRKDMSFFSQMILWDINIMLLRGKLNNILWNLDIDANDSKITGWVSGSFMIVRSDIFNAVGGFDTETFLYAEEMIISQKFRDRGYDTYYYDGLTLTHKHRGSAPSKRQRLLNHESKRYFYKKYKKVNEFLLKISDLNFQLVELLYYIRHINKN